MNVVRTKVGAQFAVIGPGGFEILAALVDAADRFMVDLTITSGTDAHTLPDPHARGEAYDVSVRGFDETLVVRLVLGLRYRLGELFTVLYETPTAPADPHDAQFAYVNPRATAPHIHLQVRTGVVYPPPLQSAPAAKEV